ncbi:threonine synthase [Nitzschia inconspicua]|uniref:Threonine synthase n=1 Tax=Nitzschia inconspicua TaxID=303405 RepID=A0A9K3Q7J6_9STRA|nr:threonine synthase [Nitzschia inconspicua]
MKFVSTRDASQLFSLEEALFSGYAPDGGLLVPQWLPQVDEATLHKWSQLDYLDLSVEVLYRFVQDDMSRNELHELLETALKGFDTDLKNLVPVVPMSLGGDNEAPNVFIAELFHGPTFCFKDFGLRVTIQWLNFFATRRNASVTLIVSTTGDTGPAAVQAVQDCNSSSRLGVLVHFPQGQISDFQRKQLTTATSTRVKIVAFQGGGDDMDVPIKNIIMTSKTNHTNDKNRVVCGVNSYNIGRPLMQMVHFVWTYLRVAERRKRDHPSENLRLDIVIPTGAMGNLAGCYMAKKMGVPLGILCAGVNINDITDVVFRTGKLERNVDQPMKKTLSDAINIQLPYNLERLLFYLTEQDHDQIRDWYSQLGGPGRCCDISTSNRWWSKLNSEFQSARVTDEEMCEAMRSTLHQYGYWADPHTCVALAAAKKLGYWNEKSIPVAIMATAAPCKFQEAMTKALGVEQWQEYERLHFPTRGKILNEMKEIPTTVYASDATKTLAENQRDWEAKARELIEQFS